MRRLFGRSKKHSRVLPAEHVDDAQGPPKTSQGVQNTTGTKPGQILTVDTRSVSLSRLQPSAGGTSQSSDASSSVRTPSDYEPLEDAQNKKSWVSWMASASGKKRRKQSPEGNQRPAVSDVFPKSRPLPAPTAVDDTTSEEDDTSDVSWSDLAGGDRLFPSATTLSPAFAQHRPRPPPKELSKAIANLHAITINSLQSPPHTTPPLVQSQSSPQFPRSSNLVNHFPPLHLTRAEVHRKRLLRRLEGRKLDRLEQASILPFSTRIHTRKKPTRTLSISEESMAASKAVGGGWSRGMKKWAMRPCFEERVVVWSVDATYQLVCAPVSRTSSFGVADLEFSEGAEALAGLHRQNELPPPPSDIYVPAANCRLPPPLVVPRKSPLHHSVSVTRLSHLHSPNNLVGAGRASMPDLTLSVGGSGDEDDLPLGVVLYRRRESHAQRKKQSEEAHGLAHKLREEAKQKDGKAKQEELQKKKFAEQVVAARERREQGRTGKSAKDPWLEGIDSGVVPRIKPRKPAEVSPIPTKDRASRRQTLSTSSPPQWTELPPSTGAPLTTPLAVPDPYEQMAFIDPLKMAMFEQGMRVWAYGESATGSWTPPRFPSAGGSTGSLAPPRFPNSRPRSFTSSLDDLNSLLSHSRTRVSPSEGGSLRSSREPSTFGQNQNRSKLNGESSRSTHSSNTLPRSSSALPDLSSGNKIVVRTGYGYAPSTSSRLAQPPATLPSNQSTEVVHYLSRPPVPHTKNMPERPTGRGPRCMTVTEGLRTKGESDYPALPLASPSTAKEGRRTLRSRSSLWSVADKLRSRTVVP